MSRSARRSLAAIDRLSTGCTLALAQTAGLLTLADDSGLEVDALDGLPGLRATAACPARARRDRVGELVMTSGQLPMREGKLVAAGKVGADVTLEQGAEAARLAAALQHLDPTPDHHRTPPLAQIPLPGFDLQPHAPT